MASLPKPSVTSSLTQLYQNQTSKTTMPNQMNFMSTLITTISSISKTYAMASSPVHEASNPVVLNSPSIYDDVSIEYAKKLKELKGKLMVEEENALQALAMIDSIQRFGIEYHFQNEIDAILVKHYTIPTNHGQDNLHEVALRFRLLRQQGYYIPAAVFDNFKEEGKFKEKLSDDIKGLMELYEASQLSIHGEDILDEAREYSYEILYSKVPLLDNNQARAVANSLKHPYYKSPEKFTAKTFTISNLHEENQWLNELEQFMKFEFQILQLQYEAEIVQILKWWKDLGLCNELKFARNQPLKWYMWSITVLSEPSFSKHRVDLIKPISMVYILDDIFDVYGTLEDLTLFTNVVDRWDIAAIEQLPDYMKICFQALNNITDEISNKVYEQHGWNPVNSLRKSWASLCSAFLVEARWFASGNMPNCEEYLKNGIVSTGVPAVLIHLLFLLGERINKENMEFIDGHPGMLSSTAKILRLADDLGSAKDEDQDGHDGSYMEYYINEHPECSSEKARNHVLQMISDEWKQLNRECLFQNPYSPTFTKVCLNVARMVPLMYSYDESCRLPILEELKKSIVELKV